MKTILPLVLSLAASGIAHAEYRTWTRSDGKTAELELVSAADGKGDFRMRDGRSVSLSASNLAPADAEILASWKPSAVTATGAAPSNSAESVFDNALDGNLVRLSGKSLKTARDVGKPSKYYLFYYTASWCGPCQKFTPSLVEFYDKNKPGSDEFEIVLITSDSDEDSMDDYASTKKMSWPHLKLSRVDKFKKEFKHPGTGIPNLVLTDLEGNLIKTSYEDGKYLGPAVVMNHLGSLLKK